MILLFSIRHLNPIQKHPVQTLRKSDLRGVFHANLEALSVLLILLYIERGPEPKCHFTNHQYFPNNGIKKTFGSELRLVRAKKSCFLRFQFCIVGYSIIFSGTR